MARAVCSVNSTLVEGGGDPSITLEALNHPKLSLRSITDACSEEYQKSLQEAREGKKAGGGVAGWAEHRSKEGHTYYFNDETDEFSWTRPDEYQGSPLVLTREEIQVGVVV